jgi:hypothetical protein
MSFADKFYKEPTSLIDQLPDEDKQNIQEMINEIKSNCDVSHLESLIVLMVKKLLRKFSQAGESVDFDSLTQEQQNMIIGEIERIAKEIKMEGNIETNKKAIQILINILKRRFSAKSASNIEEEYEFLTKEQQEKLQKDLEKMVIYLYYMAINPNRIAGETERDNFINNVVIHGVETALRFSKKHVMPKDIDKNILKDLQHKHDIFTKRGFSAFTDHEGGGKGKGI